MIPRAIWFVILWLGRLLIPGRAPRKSIDPNAPCAACGNRQGKIRTVRRSGKLFVEHECETCGAVFPEELIGDQSKVTIRAAGEP